jgi:hydrogenase-4 component F
MMNMTDLPLLYLLPAASAIAGALLVLLPAFVMEEAFSVLASLASLAFSIALLFLPDRFDQWIYVDGFSKLMLLVISLVWAASVLYSLSYLAHVKNPLFGKRYYFFLLNIFAAALLLAVSLANVGLIWFAIEATTVAGALLVALDNSESAIEASWRFIIVVSSGLVLALLALVFLYAATGSLVLTRLKDIEANRGLATMAALLAVIGFGTKAGLFPMFTWLPDVHGKAPSPISAMFSALVLPTTIFALVRILAVANIPRAKDLLFAMGLLTLGVSALLMTVQRDLKRLFAYSTIENMAIIMMGFSLGGQGAVGAVLLVASHALAKSSAFYLSGNVLIEYDTVRIDEIHGLGRRLPGTGFALFFSSLSVTGAPPFASFVAELIILGAVWARHGAVWAVIAGAFLALAFLAVNSKVVAAVFSPTSHARSKTSLLAIAVPALALALSFVLVFFVPAIVRLVAGGLGL